MPPLLQGGGLVLLEQVIFVEIVCLGASWSQFRNKNSCYLDTPTITGKCSNLEKLVKRLDFLQLSGNRTFRCMWRGCDNETTSLNGIIMHVRHAHIGYVA